MFPADSQGIPRARDSEASDILLKPVDLDWLPGPRGVVEDKEGGGTFN